MVANELRQLANILVSSLGSEFESAIGLQLARSDLLPFLKSVTTIDSAAPGRSLRSDRHELKRDLRIGVSFLEYMRYISNGIPSGPGDLFFGEVKIASEISFSEIG